MLCWLIAKDSVHYPSSPDNWYASWDAETIRQQGQLQPNLPKTSLTTLPSQHYPSNSALPIPPSLPYDVGPARGFLGEAEKTPASRVNTLPTMPSQLCHARAHDPNTGKYPELSGWRSLTIPTLPSKHRLPNTTLPFPNTALLPKDTKLDD